MSSDFLQSFAGRIGDVEMGDVRSEGHSSLSETSTNGSAVPAAEKPHASPPPPPLAVPLVKLVPALRSGVYTPPADLHDWAYFVGLALVTLAAVATRLWTITEPEHVA